MNDIHVCPSTLKAGYETYSPSAKRHLLGGKKVSHILPYKSLSSGAGLAENKGHLSLSGAQEKYSAVIDNGVFRLTEDNERGTYILKPKLTGFDNVYFPADLPTSVTLNETPAKTDYRAGEYFDPNGLSARMTFRSR